MKRTYEAMLLLDNREVKQGWEALKSMVTGFFTKHGADIKSARRWDERRLAYPIERQLRGTYLLVYFESDTDALTSIRRELEYSEPVLRHLTHVCEEIPADAYDPEEEFDVEAVRVESQGDPIVPEEEEEAEGEGAEGESSEGEGDAEKGDAEKGDAEAKSEGEAAEGSSEGETAEAAATDAGTEEEKKED